MGQHQAHWQVTSERRELRWTLQRFMVSALVLGNGCRDFSCYCQENSHKLTHQPDGCVSSALMVSVLSCTRACVS